MPGLQTFLNNDRKVMPLVFLASLLMYGILLHPVFLHLNSTLSSITLDSIKNYYTFVYNIRHGAFDCNFTGMNYPFGEHVVYTDCQPLIGYILKLIPPLYPYSIGILHGLLFFSFIITPVILYKIMRIWQVPAVAAFFFALGLGLLSPQFQKINGGHHALAYGCIFPYAILLLVSYFKKKNTGSVIKLSLFNTLVFFIHPYLGFCLCLLSFLTLLLFVLAGDLRKRISSYLQMILAGIFPAAFFKAFMLITDSHAGRPIEPFGSEVLVENWGSLLVPAFGPFSVFFSSFFPAPSEHFEGHSYLGAGTLLVCLFFVLLLPFILKRKLFSVELLALFVSASLILFFSFGWHHEVLKWFKINIPELKQFRAVSRFAYVFYFSLPLVCVVALTRFFSSVNRPVVTVVTGGIFFGLHLWEGCGYLKMHEQAYWRFPNFFNETYLNTQDKSGLAYINSSHAQAILPLPMFHGGSEMYDRTGASNAMIPSMLYSYHTGLPIISMMGSRTSITETEALIGVLNSYKRTNPLFDSLRSKNIVVIKTSEFLMPDEERLARKVYFEPPQDSITLGKITGDKLTEIKLNKQIVNLGDTAATRQHNIVFIDSAERKPFIPTEMKDYEKITVLPANTLAPGKYVLSFHYHYPEKIYSWLATNLIIAEGENDSYEWKENIPVRIMSGFYSGFGVFEYFIDIKAGTRYEFIVKGLADKKYRLSHFLIRPEHVSTSLEQGEQRLLNNFPEK